LLAAPANGQTAIVPDECTTHYVTVLPLPDVVDMSTVPEPKFENMNTPKHARYTSDGGNQFHFTDVFLIKDRSLGV
jgi:hypothetical protein